MEKKWKLLFMVQGIEYGVYANLVTLYRKPYSLYLRGTVGFRAAFDLLVFSREYGNIIDIFPYSQMRSSKSKTADNNSSLGLSPKPLNPKPQTPSFPLPSPLPSSFGLSKGNLVAVSGS